MEQGNRSDSTVAPGRQADPREAIEADRGARIAEILTPPTAERLAAVQAGPEAEDADSDAELIRLGRLLDVAHAREIAACRRADDAQEEAARLAPQRPACLFYGAADAGLNVYGWHVLPEYLNGLKISRTDIARLRTLMPMTHEVLRPIRAGERAHLDHPGHCFDIAPHPEAQARAEEIITAWDPWRNELDRLDAERLSSAAEREAEEAGDAAADLARQVANQPARTAAGFRTKLRALSYYDAGALPTDLPEQPDPDQRLARSLRLDMERDKEADADEPITVEGAAQLEFIAYTFEEPVDLPRGWHERCRVHTLGLHIADRTLRMTKLELMSLIHSTANAGADAEEAVYECLNGAKQFFEGRSKLLELALGRYVIAAAAVELEGKDRQDRDGEVRS